MTAVVLGCLGDVTLTVTSDHNSHRKKIICHFKLNIGLKNTVMSPIFLILTFHNLQTFRFGLTLESESSHYDPSWGFSFYSLKLNFCTVSPVFFHQMVLEGRLLKEFDDIVKHKAKNQFFR